MYRHDLDAALARAANLEEELQRARQGAASDEARIAALSREVQQLHQKIARLSAKVPSEKKVADMTVAKMGRGRLVGLVFIVLIVTLSCTVGPGLIIGLSALQLFYFGAFGLIGTPFFVWVLRMKDRKEAVRGVFLFGTMVLIPLLFGDLSYVQVYRDIVACRPLHKRVFDRKGTVRQSSHPEVAVGSDCQVTVKNIGNDPSSCSPSACRANVRCAGKVLYVGHRRSLCKLTPAGYLHVSSSIIDAEPALLMEHDDVRIWRDTTGGRKPWRVSITTQR